MDNKPFANIMPFGLCTSLANPITAAQTAAALGVLTPGVCTPVVPAPWVPGAPTALTGSMPTLTRCRKCNCAYGGVITIMNPGANADHRHLTGRSTRPPWCGTFASSRRWTLPGGRDGQPREGLGRIPTAHRSHVMTAATDKERETSWRPLI